MPVPARETTRYHFRINLQRNSFRLKAGIELGIPGKDAMQMAAYSMEGATELILNHNTHPLLEIEKVTTPGGTTIKGLNELEHKGFTSSIIQAIKSSATTLIDKEEEDVKIFR